MDIVYIRELEVKTIIGIYDWEREQKQVVSINLEMASDIRKSADSDSIEHASVSYTHLTLPTILLV